MNQAASSLATRWVLEKLYTIEVCRKKGGATELLTKEENGLFLDWDIFYLGVVLIGPI